MISELSILDVIDVADAAEKTDVAGLVPPSSISSMSPGVYISEVDHSAIIAGDGIAVRSVYDDITTNINVDEAQVRRLKADTAEFNEDVSINGSANLASAYITGDLDVYGCVSINGPTTISTADVNYLSVRSQLELTCHTRVESCMLVTSAGDLRYTDNYMDRSMVQDMIDVRNDVNYLLGQTGNDLYSHPVITGLQCQIAELNNTVAALRQMLP